MSRLAPIAALLAACVPLAACGSSRSNTTSQVSAASKQANGIALAECFRSHGVPNFPDPSTTGNGGIQIQTRRNGSSSSTEVNGVPVNGPAFQSAMSACRRYLPNGGTPSAAKTAQAKAQALAMARCMRSHGVPDFPDPTFRTGPGGGVGISIGGPGIDPSSPAFQAAQKVCGTIFGAPKSAGSQVPGG